jgi:hypothetical protein
MAPQPLPPEQIKTPRGIGINEGEGGARVSAQLRAAGPDPAHEREVHDQMVSEMGAEMRKRWTPDETGCCLNCRRGLEAHSEGLGPVGPRTLRHFVNRGGELVEVESVVRETR